MFLTNILPSLFFLFYSCEPALKRENISQIQGISLTQKIQIYANGQEIPDTLNWHVDIYTHEEKLLYADLIDFFVMNNGTMEIKKTQNFFLQTKTDSYGYFFNNCKPMIDTCKGYSGHYKMKLPADSFLKKQWYNNKFGLEPFMPYLVFKKDKYAADSEGFYKEYEFNKKTGDTLVKGSLQLSYSSGLKIPFEYSISNHFDTIKGFKLNDIIVDMKTYILKSSVHKRVDSSNIKLFLKIDSISEDKQTEGLLKYFNTTQSAN